ncbi:hypothetical protein VTL71DRAFT_4959 [Oculimacula yallundae]|uniref:Uncharacterized protein n=1 Tax=Oculimacula yallundae TaxID=86028 RepID=A0ABR4C474_9HELO
MPSSSSAMKSVVGGQNQTLTLLVCTLPGNRFNKQPNSAIVTSTSQAYFINDQNPGPTGPRYQESVLPAAQRFGLSFGSQSHEGFSSKREWTFLCHIGRRKLKLSWRELSDGNCEMVEEQVAKKPLEVQT